MGRKKRKVSLNAFKIFFTSVKVYFLYLDKFVKYLMFPVFGQIFGLIALFIVAYLFTVNMTTLGEKIPFLLSERNLLITYCCCLAPFFVIFLKAFYEYLIAFSALNSVCYIITPKKKVQEISFDTHNEAIERRIFHYIVLLFLFTLISIILTVPVSWIFIPFFVLVFQVFALEQSAGARYSISRSVDLVKGHYLQTLIAIILVVLFTYIFIPELFIWAFNYFKITQYLVIPVEKFLSAMPIDFDSVNAMLKANMMPMTLEITECSKKIVDATIYTIFIMFTLPLRCCTFTNLYAALDIEAIGRNAEEKEDKE